MSRFGLILAPAMVLTVALAVAGCGTAVPALVAPSPSPTYAATGDGVLRIGTLLPPSATAQVAGVEVAVREINEQGGINGVPVEVFHRTSGDETTQTAEDSLAALVALGVDVVIGPASAELAERLAEPAGAAGIPLISPSATSLAAIEDAGLVFTTTFSGSEGAALASALTESDVTTIAYLATNDEAGDAGLAGLTAALEKQDVTVAFEASVTAAATNFASVVTKTKKAKPDAVVVSAATTEQAVGLLSALTAAGFDGSSLWLAGRSTADYSTTLAAGALEGATGIVVGAQPDPAFTLRLHQADPSVTSYASAVEAYDATIMAALAVSLNGDDGGAAISRHLRSVSTGGIPCASFGECLSVLATESDIDYSGRSGPVDLSETGDAALGASTLVSYTATNSFEADRVIIAG